jgi:hypothetical protein
MTRRLQSAACGTQTTSRLTNLERALESIVTILVLLLAVIIIGGSLARFTRLPLPMMQIMLGG